MVFGFKSFFFLKKNLLHPRVHKLELYWLCMVFLIFLFFLILAYQHLFTYLCNVLNEENCSLHFLYSEPTLEGVGTPHPANLSTKQVKKINKLNVHLTSNIFF
jgi:hypothetical protein